MSMMSIAQLCTAGGKLHVIKLLSVEIPDGGPVHKASKEPCHEFDYAFWN